MALSSRAVDGHQMYFGGSVVGKASLIDPQISPTPPLIFTKGQKLRNLALFSTSLNFEPRAFENAAKYPNSEIPRSDVLAKFGEVGSTHP